MEWDELLEQSTLSEALQGKAEGEPLPVVVELNVLHARGIEGAREEFLRLFGEVAGGAEAHPVADTYMAATVTLAVVRELIDRDQDRSDPRERTIYRVWPDFPVKPLIDKSVQTVKGDAARRSYEASGIDIAWAVIDSGIDAQHPHFQHHESLMGDVTDLHRNFAADGADPLTDPYGHGTHVAGIIAGGLVAGASPIVAQRVKDSTSRGPLDRREVRMVETLSGVAPNCKLVSLRVLDAGGASKSTDVMRALEYIRKDLNGHGKLQRVHGANLSVGYEFDAQWFACGQSPLCVEVDRLVQSGVVVVTAAGNTGYGAQTAEAGRTKTGLTLTINDPGNAAQAITVGATHRDAPHTYGVSYFSSKGPTGDGRLKPDLVAPGERITSCAAGRRLDPIRKLWESQEEHPAAYVDESGTSMAAPHVSGAIAAFLSIRREFIGRPREVKDIFCRNATSLGRERYFEGYGMVDLMRAIQAV